MVTVSRFKLPNLYQAFLEIAYDNGAVNRLEPEKSEYMLPDDLQQEAEIANENISRLRTDELETLCCGEYQESQDVLLANQLNPCTDVILQRFFEEWM